MPDVEITPGIRRVGPGLINVYLVEEAGEVTIVDAGAPGYWNALPAELAAMGRTLADVRAVVLTHAHLDHVGFAERLRRERGVPVRVHELDAALARHPGTPRLDQHKLRPFPILRFLAHALANGMLRSTPILEVSTFSDGATLDVPGALRVIHVPGHSEGSAALHVPSRDAVFIGDAFVMLDHVSGDTGPRIGPFNANVRQAYESLTRLDRIDARLVLPGHGQPWTAGLSEALRVVRQVGLPR
jgi:glyoxylase-like metal-dependent hydrolase (beta-lactamase superfamily II)